MEERSKGQIMKAASIENDCGWASITLMTDDGTFNSITISPDGSEDAVSVIPSKVGRETLASTRHYTSDFRMLDLENPPTPEPPIVMIEPYRVRYYYGRNRSEQQTAEHLIVGRMGDDRLVTHCHRRILETATDRAPAWSTVHCVDCMERAAEIDPSLLVHRSKWIRD
jgi:hypothetical protein